MIEITFSCAYCGHEFIVESHTTENPSEKTLDFLKECLPHKWVIQDNDGRIDIYCCAACAS